MINQTTDRTLLLEVCGQEIPSGMQQNFIHKFKSLVVQELIKSMLIDDDSAVLCYITPIRIVCIVTKMKNRFIVKGPKLSANKSALSGFMKKYFIDDRLKLKEEDGYFIYDAVVEDSILSSMLGPIVLGILQKSVSLWPKRMHWNSSGTPWVRPISNILCLLDKFVVNFEFSGVKSSRKTCVTKRESIISSLLPDQLNPDSLVINNAGFITESCRFDGTFMTEYEEKVRNFGVILDSTERVVSIFAQILLKKLLPEVVQGQSRFDDHSIFFSHLNDIKDSTTYQKDTKRLAMSYAKAVFYTDLSSGDIDPDFVFARKSMFNLLWLMAGMAEDPYIVDGKIPAEYFILPFEILSTTMIKHQFYIPVIKGNDLMFCFVLDGEAKYTDTAVENILQGNLKVLNARLSDALFAYNSDKKLLSNVRTLQQINGLLQKLSVGDNLGTLQDRCDRVYKILYKILFDDPRVKQSKIISFFFTDNADKIKLAIALTQIDLITSVVKELPELRGTIGIIYFDSWWTDLFSGDIPDNNKCIINAFKYAARQQYSNTISFEVQKNLDSDFYYFNERNFYNLGNNFDEFFIGNGRLIVSAIKIEYILSNIIRGHVPTSSSDPFGLRTSASSVISNIVEPIFASTVSYITKTILSTTNNSLPRLVNDHIFGSTFLLPLCFDSLQDMVKLCFDDIKNLDNIVTLLFSILSQAVVVYLEVIFGSTWNIKKSLGNSSFLFSNYLLTEGNIINLLSSFINEWLVFIALASNQDVIRQMIEVYVRAKNISITNHFGDLSDYNPDNNSIVGDIIANCTDIDLDYSQVRSVFIQKLGSNALCNLINHFKDNIIVTIMELHTNVASLFEEKMVSKDKDSTYAIIRIVSVFEKNIPNIDNKEYQSVLFHAIANADSLCNGLSGLIDYNLITQTSFKPHPILNLNDSVVSSKNSSNNALHSGKTVNLIVVPSYNILSGEFTVTVPKVTHF